MGIMASERGGQVFATDERFVVNDNFLWRNGVDVLLPDFV